MREQNPPSPFSMVRIDGSTVRRLREDKGLTQLYLATAVGVTTDTISRWENRHYQSVKLDNARRLAAALEVELDLILEVSEDDQPAETVIKEDDQAPPDRAAPLGKSVIMLAVCLILLVAGGAFLLFQKKSAPLVIPKVSRHLPSHFMPGKSFPVVIAVETPLQPLSLVIKEKLAANVQVVASSSSLQMEGKAELKWVVKHLTEKKRFGYMMKAEHHTPLYFHGTVTSRAGRHKEIDIGGRQALGPALFHWADSDQDGIISDDEILVVYDDFDGVPGLQVDVELVEDMWMGSGYRWDSDKEAFVVIP